MVDGRFVSTPRMMTLSMNSVGCVKSALNSIIFDLVSYGTLECRTINGVFEDDDEEDIFNIDDLLKC